MGWMTGVQLSAGEMMGFLSSTSRSALGPTQSSIQWVLGGSYPGVKWLGYEADHSSPFSAEVNVWSYTSTPPIYLDGVVPNCVALWHDNTQ